MTTGELREILNDIKCLDYRFEIVLKGDAELIMARYDEPDIVSGDMAVQSTRKWYISPHMTRSEVVQTALLCVLTSMEHRAREGFKYRGQRVYGPHFNVEALHEAASRKAFDYRKVKP